MYCSHGLCFDAQNSRARDENRNVVFNLFVMIDMTNG